MLQEEIFDVTSGFDILLPKEEKKPVIKANYINQTTIEILNKYLKGICKKVVVEYPYYDRDYLSNYRGHWSERFKKFSKKSYRLLFFGDELLEDFIGYITLNPTFSKGHIGRMFFKPNPFVEDGAKLILSNFKIHTGGQEEVVEYFPALCQLDPCVCAHVAAWSVTKFKSNWKEYADKTSYEIERATPKNWTSMNTSRGISIAQMAEILAKQGNTPILKHINNTYHPIELFEEIISYIQSKIPVIITIGKHEHAVVGVGYGKTRDVVKMFKILKSYDSVVSVNQTNIKGVFLYPASYFVDSVYVNDDLSFPYKRVDSSFYQTTDSNAYPDNYSEIESESLNEDKQTELQSSVTSADYRSIDFNGLIIPLYHRINMNFDFIKIKFIDFFNSSYSEFGWSEKEDTDFIYNIFLTSNNTFREQIFEAINSNPDSSYCSALRVFTKLELPRFVWIVEISTSSSFEKQKINGFIVMDSTASTNDPAIVLGALGSKKCIYYDDGAYYASNLNDESCALEMSQISNNLTVIHNVKKV